MNRIFTRFEQAEAAAWEWNSKNPGQPMRCAHHLTFSHPTTGRDDDRADVVTAQPTVINRPDNLGPRPDPIWPE